ncbi:MAG: rpoE [Bacteroidetes bacterium]|nr:rpoE [Bacteroidota bacterium]
MVRQNPEIEEVSLIRKAKQGDELAFTKLVHKYEDMVYRFSLTVCRDNAKAEEAYHDTFVNVFKKLKQFDGKAKFSTWLYRIVANNCLMKRRRRKIDIASVPLETPEGFMEDPLRDATGQVIQTVPSWKDTPLDGLMNEELKNVLDEAIGKLPADYRAVFLLRDIEAQSAEETAKILKLSVPAVKSRLHRARAFLREQLHGYMKA